MGLMCLQIAKYHGAVFILAADPIRERAHLAANLGANEYLYEEIPSAAHKFNSYFDVVIEASGTQAALTLAGDIVVNHGRIIIIGYHQSNGGMRQINMKQWNYKAIDIVNGHIRNENEKFDAMNTAINLLREEKFSTKGLVSVFPLSEINEAFESLQKREQGLIKGVLKVRE
jgi:threonine dehydrogenase-like Zn-dependent dehydrogenase